jgi:hypothetical protein
VDLWAAFLGTMRTARARRINRHEAEQLLTGGPAAPDREELSHLLDLACAPPRADELAGREAAVAAFVRARQELPAAPARRRSLVARRLSRALGIKVLVGFLVLFVGGTALAAGTGNLPNPVQHGAHQLLSPLGVPVPDDSPAGRAGGAPSGGTGQPGPGGPAGAGSPGSRTPSTANPVMVGHCRTWQAAQKNHPKAIDAAAMQALTEAAGGVQNIPGYCTALLEVAPSSDPNASTGPDPPPTGTAKPGPPPKPSHSPKDHGRGHPTPTP